MTSQERRAIQSDDDLRTHIARIAELSRDEAGIMLETSESMASIEEDRDRRLKPIHEELDPLVVDVWEYVDAHPELFAKSSEMKFPDAVLSRIKSTRLEILDMELLIKTLRRLGEGAIIKIEESVAKVALKQKKGLVERVRNAAVGAVQELPVWNFSISFLPQKTASQKGGLPPTLKHDVPARDMD